MEAEKTPDNVVILNHDPIVDPLRQGLLLLCRQLGRPLGDAELVDGMPLEHGRLPLHLVARALRRADITAQVTRQPLRRIDRYLLPADAEPGSAALSPLHADLAGLPPLLVQVGEDELLRDDSLRLAQRAGEQGVAVRLQRYAGCWHVFQAHAGVLASADRALDEAAAFVVECSAEGDRCRTS